MPLNTAHWSFLNLGIFLSLIPRFLYLNPKNQIRLVGLFIITVIIVITVTISTMLAGGVTDFLLVMQLAYNGCHTHPKPHTQTHSGNLAQFDTLNTL